jgi:hypothetical protein
MLVKKIVFLSNPQDIEQSRFTSQLVETIDSDFFNKMYQFCLTISRLAH